MSSRVFQFYCKGFIEVRWDNNSLIVKVSLLLIIVLLPTKNEFTCTGFSVGRYLNWLGIVYSRCLTSKSTCHQVLPLIESRCGVQMWWGQGYLLPQISMLLNRHPSPAKILNLYNCWIVKSVQHTVSYCLESRLGIFNLFGTRTILKWNISWLGSHYDI